MSEDQLRLYRTRLRQATAALEALRGKLAAEQGRREPLAIVGMGCRFPQADGPEAFWTALARGVDGVREIPGSRWPRDAIPGDRPEVRWAGLLDAVDGFDAAFFGVSPREAERLDPQQRLLLEVAWEALEDAGARATELAGAQVGVFAGLNSLDHQHRMMRRGLADVDAYTATGNLLSTASGRISYSFGFEGPCVAIDTACSSSLVAVALACQSLRAGECEVALAGGVTLLLSPYMMALAAGTQALAPDGRCKVLDARANGFVRGEGCGMVVLKRLADAQRDGDLVRAVIPGWAINQDGRSTGLTAPNVRSQEDLLRRALERARVTPDEVGYVEMHGTGTPLGDPIEADALRAVLGTPRADGSACVLGAVKTNVGHLEAAAGVAGLIKAVLALEREGIPRNLHFRRLNPRISLAGTPFVVPRERVAWPRGGKRRVAGVSSFGISGTNVHVVVAEAPAVAVTQETVTRAAELVVLSARGAAALDGQAARLRDFLRAGRGASASTSDSSTGDASSDSSMRDASTSDASMRDASPSDAAAELGDVAFSLATTRGAMEHRLAIAATSRAQLCEALAVAARGEVPVGGARAVAAGRGKLALLFTGQGAQAPGMGRGLYAAWPVFRAALDECFEHFDRALPRPLREVMWASPGSAEAALLDETVYTQPALFAVEVALAALWRSWGVAPDLVAGHSIGEIAAACAVGVMSLADAARLVAARGRLMQALPAGGAMASIEAGEDVAAAVLERYPTVAIAAVNGPTQVVVSGAAAEVLKVCEEMAGRGVRVRPLRVSHAFHSPLMDPMLAEFRRVVATIDLRAPERPLVSGLTGALAGAEVATAEHWVRHAREAVRFADVARALHAAGARSFLEVGPRPTLLGLVTACLPGEDVALVPSLRAAGDEAAGVLAALGSVWAAGGEVRWSGVFPAGARRVRLPTYAWQRERHWLDAPDEAARAGEATGHPLLGVRLATAGVDAVFEATLGSSTHAWLGDHRVAGRVVVPAAAIAELVRAALAHGAERGPQVRGLVLMAPLVVPETGALRVQVVVTGAADGVQVAVYSQPAGAPAGAGWTRHASAGARDGGRNGAEARDGGRDGAETRDGGRDGTETRDGGRDGTETRDGGRDGTETRDGGRDGTETRDGGREVATRDVDLAALRARCAEQLDVAAIHARFASFGIAYGPAFRGLRSLWRGEGEALAEVAVAAGAWGAGLSPALLDAGLQAVLAVLPGAEDELRMPFEIGGFAVHGAGVDAAWAHVRLRDGAVDVTFADAGGSVVAEVEGLRLQVADGEALRGGSAVPGALYRLAWQELPLAARDGATGRWVIVADGTSRLAAVLASRLVDCVVTDPDGLADVLEQLEEPRVLCVWGGAAEDVPAAARRVAIAGVTVVQALAGRAGARLWWVTGGAVQVADGDAVAVAAAPAWGLGRTVMQEHPELGCVLIDVADDDADAVVRELAADDGEDQVAWRAGRRFVARLVRAADAPGLDSPISTAPRGGDPATRGAVLVTGGLGALGLHVARWLALRGAGHLVLTGRRGLATPGAVAAVAGLEALGARVTVAAVDVADRDALAAALRGLPLRGVVHAAGVLEDGLLAAQSPASVARVFAPKVDGAWNLHALTAGGGLEFFVMFSSLAGVLGAAGQGNYAAANGFLDALAAHRRALGLPGQSVAWGAWSEGGMAAGLDAALQARMARQGFGALTPAQGVALLEQAMARPEAQLGAAAIDLSAIGRAGATAPVWRALLRGAPVRAAGGGPREWAARLAGLSEARRVDAVRAAVQAEVARVLAWTGAEPLPTARPLQELGLDSLMAVELRDVLGRRFGATLPATLAFDHPTVEALTRRLLETVLAAVKVSAPVEAPRAVDAPIAIVGMGCRLPGGVDDPAALWRLLDAGGDAIARVPSDRWDADALYDADPDAPGKATTRNGGFLPDVDRFDPAFFGISPREAVRMDPQQRLLLETGWEALEHAGIAPERLMGSDTGVFVGLMYQEYGAMVDDLAALDGYVSTGGAASVAAGRLSYVLGLRGPSMTVDTACSSSLVTVHLACQALRQGECSLALAGGAALMLTPTVFVEFSRLRGLAADGRCKSFAATADGVGWSEGCGLLVLKRLPDALRDGDTVLAVIRGSAVNQDGRSNGLTAPHGPAQEAVIRRALAQAGVAAAEVDYVECHGTGTALGDPIEVQALGAVMAGRPAGRPLIIGSVKSNLGHTQAAAGAAGIMKVVLALDHERIPQSLHFLNAGPSPHIPWDTLPVAVAAEAVAWPRGATPRRAGVSSFGVSGTNAHVVIEEAPAPAATRTAGRTAELVVLSARDAAALDEVARRLRAHLELHPELALADVAATLATGRSAMDLRRALVVGSAAELVEALAARVDGTRALPGRPRVVFVFPGQGGQWAGMARQLLREEPVVRASLERSDAEIFAEVGWSVLAELAESSRMDRIEVVQPTLFAVEVALAALWRSWGVEPDAVVGHSMGEVAAAHVAGALSLKDAVRVICRRSRLLQQISGAGAMAMVELTQADAEVALRGLEDRLSVAACNGPRATVLAGEPAALDEVLARLAAAGVFCRRVRVDVASHSPQVEPLRPALLAALAGLRPEATRVPMRSTVTGAALTGAELTGDYWLANLREPVRFAAAISGLLADDHAIFVEMSPHPVLTPAVDELLRAAGRPGVAVGSQRRDQDERRALLESLAAVWLRGGPVRWDRVVQAGARRVALPTYPWQRGRYWIEVDGRSKEQRAGHPLLGVGHTLSTGGVRLWEATLGGGRPRWLEDHRVHGAAVLPGAGFLEMAIAAGVEALGGAVVVEDMSFEQVLAVDAARQVQTVTTEDGAGRLRLQVASRVADGAWVVHARGVVRRAEQAQAGALDVAGLREALGEAIAAEAVYARLAARGLEYGPAFRGVARLWCGPEQALGEVRVRVADADRCHVHPALLDACLQVTIGAFGADDATWLPVEVGALRLVNRGRIAGALWCHAKLRPEAASAGPRRRCADLQIADATGQIVAEVAGLVVQQVAGRRGREEDGWFIALAWERVAAPVRRGAPGRVLVLGDGGGLGGPLRVALEAAGHTVVHAVAGADGRWPFDDGHPATLRALLGDVFRGAAPTAVVHLRSLEGDDAIEGALVRGPDSALHTVQAIVGMGYRDAPRLWLVTRGAQAVGDGPVAVEQAPLLGLARVIAMEHPELRCARVDLDPRRPAGEAELLAAELGGDEVEHEVAWRGAVRQVARLVRRAPIGRVDGVRRWGPRATGSYLITGGLGGLGLGVAGWLAERGAGHVVLVGRSGADSAEQRAAIAGIEARGARVTVARADVGEREQVAAVLAMNADSGPPLAGVVHAAGVLDDGLLVQQTRARLRRVMAAKIGGALHLDALTRGQGLDFFVMYASAAGLIGAPGQGNYAAANTFLDALAHRRRAAGLAALSVDWGAFSEVGLATSAGARLADRGLRSLTPAEGLAALERLLDADATQAAVVPLDVRRWVEFFPAAAASPMLAPLLTAPARRDAGADGLRERVTRAGAQAGRALLVEFLRGEAARVLRIGEGGLDVDAPLTALGMDSLMGLELRNRVEAALGVRVPATLLWTYPTAAALGEHLLGLLGMTGSTDAIMDDEVATPPVVAEDLDEDGLLALLDASLARARPDEGGRG